MLVDGLQSLFLTLPTLLPCRGFHIMAAIMLFMVMTLPPTAAEKTAIGM